MPFKLVYLLLSIGLVVPQTTSFPLRRCGVEKRVTRQVAKNRDLILCWVVQIMTDVDCHTDQRRDNNVIVDNISRRDSYVPINNKMGSSQATVNSCQKEQVEKHISVLSQEVGLHTLHKFDQFHDHFLLCHLDINKPGRALQKNLTNSQPKSHIISQIHQLHIGLKSQNTNKFLKFKDEIETRLQQHDEVLWFGSEYVHRHHSRSRIPSKVDVRLSHNHIHVSLPKQTSHTISNISSSSKKNNSIKLYRNNSETLFKSLISSSIPNHSRFVTTASHNCNNLTVNSNAYLNHVFQARNKVDMLPHFQNFFASPGNKLNRLDKFNLPVHSILRRSPNIKFNDPKYLQQWHLKNWLTKGMDINVTGVWLHNLTGHGVTVAVVDDGLEWTNPDLKANYNYRGSWDMNDDDPDPSPSSNKLSNHHGTRCAGEIAAVANNHICGVGAAFEAQISGLRVLDGVMTDSMEAEAFNKHMDINDIYSCSWGPDDDGKTVDGPHLMAAKAMKYGVDFGRRGYGSIFVLASGNGGANQDNCNFDGYANSIYTVTIGAVDDKGGMPFYAEECASMLGVTFSSGTANKRDIVTTDWTVGDANGCTESHTGTSAAAPLAAAMIALMLQARPCLTWRDVQYIIILTGQKVDVESAHFQRNGAGLYHSHKHGFGLLNSWRLVNAARVWEMVPWLTSYSYAEADLSLVVPKGKNRFLKVDHVVSEVDTRGLNLFILENVQLTISMTHPCRGKIEITMTSPAGTVSVLAAQRPLDNSSDGFNDWTFTTVGCWGEIPTGNWSFHVIDHDDDKFSQGKVTKWRLTLFGTPMSSEEFQNRQKRVESAMNGHSLDSKPLPCPPPPRSERVSIPLSDRTLKVVILVGVFCFVMAVYETFEYIFCYNDEKKETGQYRRLLDQESGQETNAASGDSTNSHPEFLQVLNGGIQSASDLGASEYLPLSNMPIHGVNESGSSESSQLLNGGVQGIRDKGDNNFRIVDNVDDDDEEDIFDAAETSRLIKEVGTHRENGGVNVRHDDIPLSTLNVERIDKP